MIMIFNVIKNATLYRPPSVHFGILIYIEVQDEVTQNE
jgi:hypothetical protein